MKKLTLFFIALLLTGMFQAQNVGIGTSMPNAKLDVNGTFKLTDGTQGAGAYYYFNLIMILPPMRPRTESFITGMRSMIPEGLPPRGGILLILT